MAEAPTPFSIETQQSTTSAETGTEKTKKGIVERTKQRAKDFAHHIRNRLRRNPSPRQSLQDIASLAPDRITFDTNRQEYARVRQDAILGNKKLSAERKNDLLGATISPTSDMDTPGQSDTTMQQFEEETKRKAPNEDKLHEQNDVPEWVKTASLPIAGETPDPELDRWADLMDKTDGDPEVVPQHIQEKVLDRHLKRTAAFRKAAQKIRDNQDPIHEPTANQRSLGEQVGTTTATETTNRPLQEIQTANKTLEEQLSRNTQDLINVMQRNGLNLADLQKHGQLFRIDSRDLLYISTLDRTSLDEILSYEDDTVKRGIRERLLADNPQNEEASKGYATIKSDVHRAIESTATDLRAQRYLKHLSENNSQTSLADSIRSDRDKLQAAGGADGELSEVKQRMVTIGGMELNAHEADNLLRTVEGLL